MGDSKIELFYCNSLTLMWRGKILNWKIKDKL